MEFDNLHQILRSLYEQMMPLCADMAGVAKGIAGLARSSMSPTGYGSRWREPNR